MKIYVLPVSGGGFAVQIGLLKAIYQATKNKTPGSDNIGIIPDIVFGSSGGNVAAYIAMIGNWRDSDIMKNSYIVNSDLFVESWMPPFFPSWLAYPLTSSIYRNGNGVKELFHKIYNRCSIGSTEIWTGTYDTRTQKSSFHCNLSMAESQIKECGDIMATHLYDADSCKYLNRDLNSIAKVCHASASIPILTEGVMINGNRHIDGGAGYASPFFAMSPKMTEVIRSKGPDEPVQIFHFSSYNMDMRFSDSIYSQSIGILIHQSLLYDRGYVISYLSQFGKVSPDQKIYRNVNYKKLGEIIKSLEGQSFAMALSPKVSPSINLLNFQGSDVINIIKQIENDFTVMVWTLLYRY